MAAKSAQAITPASAETAMPVADHRRGEVIIRRATPPCVRKLPARMKNGIAMISNFSMPVNSFSATDSIGTVVMREEVGEHGQAERDRIGIPVSIRANSRAKMIQALPSSMPASFSATGMPMRSTGISAGQRGRRRCAEQGAAHRDLAAGDRPGSDLLDALDVA